MMEYVESQEIESRIRLIFAALFRVAPNDLTENSSRDTVPAWDSLQHLNLILALEEEFGINLTPEDSTQMLNLGLIYEIVQEKLAITS